MLASCLVPVENADISVLVGGPHHGPVVPSVGCAAVLVLESVVLLGSVLCVPPSVLPWSSVTKARALLLRLHPLVLAPQ